MANSLRPTGKAKPIEANGDFVHAPSGKRYHLTRLAQRRSTLSGQDTLEVPATHTIGSGKNARSYLNRTDQGELTQLPLSWYTQEKRWEMSPGYSAPNHSDFSRVVEPGCLFCHTAYPSAGASQPTLETGIDCQRCHGPGSEHALNPKKANTSRYAGMDVCLQCHLQSTSEALPHAVRRFDRAVYSFRPGEKLSDYAVYFDLPPGLRDTNFEINSHGYRLLQAPCFRSNAEKLQCITCHDPHGELLATSVRERTRTACLSCHSAHPGEGRNNCADCHMPARRAQDVVHVVMRDHRITRNRPTNLTAPMPERQGEVAGAPEIMRPYDLSTGLQNLYLGVAYLRGQHSVQLGLNLLSEVPSLPNEALADMVKALDATGQTAAAVNAIAQAGSKLSSAEHLAFGEVLLHANRLDEADLHLRGALPLPKAYMGLAYIALKKGKHSEAAEHWRTAANSAENRTEALVNLSTLNLERGEFQEAERNAVRSLAFEPNSAEANSVYSRALAARGEFTGATERAKRAVALNPAYPEARYHYGRLLHRAGNRAGAINHYLEAVRLRPELYGAHLSLGIAYAETGAYAQAAERFRAALKLKPDLREAEQNLNIVEQQLRRGVPAPN